MAARLGCAFVLGVDLSEHNISKAKVTLAAEQHAGKLQNLRFECVRMRRNEEE